VSARARTAEPVALLFACAAAVLGCSNSSTQCTGPPIRCENFPLAACSRVTGCTPNPTCIVQDLQTAPCSTFSDASHCPSPKCAFANGTCSSICGQITNKGNCNGTRATEVDMYGFPVWTCSWAECVGTPPKMFCDEFPKDMCPADLGCSVQKVCANADC
jgi:hypothetical protein